MPTPLDVHFITSPAGKTKTCAIRVAVQKHIFISDEKKRDVMLLNSFFQYNCHPIAKFLTKRILN
ncbi:MAG: hypothetical protein LCH58_15450 [Bacteroidetes bacterium]|uniref:hypothetical protein n=1 Tax=Phnomibacter sp. TaxID=2836217 RepID=UPI002FDC9B09|nr:hypothetical protein [Bacteroidota bacterium]